MKEKRTPPVRKPGWLRLADAVFLLSWRRVILLLLILVLTALLTWTIFADRSGLLPALVAELGVTAIPLYLLLALGYTIVRTQPRRRCLFLSPYTLLLIPAFILGVVLHNVLYAAFYPYFERQGGDEGVFFILALIVLPLYFLVQLIYTAFTLRKRGETIIF